MFSSTQPFNTRTQAVQATMADDKLPALVQALPAELYTEIYSLTFTATNQPRYIKKKYKPPVLLRIDRTTREIFAKSYYRESSTFVISKALVTDWIRSLPKHHLDLISDIKLRDANAWFSYSMGRTMYAVPIESLYSARDKMLRRDLKNLSDNTKSGVLKVRDVGRSPKQKGVWICLDKVTIPL